MHAKGLIALLAFCALLGATACSSGSNNVLNSGAPPTEADVQSVMGQVVVPTLDRLGALHSEGKQASSAAPPAVSETDCQEWDDCSNEEGNHTVCHDDGNNTFTFNFDDCHRFGGTVDGSWSFDPSPAPGSASFNLTVDDVHLGGSVAYDFDFESGICVRQEVNDFSSSGPDWTITTTGSALYCLFKPGVGEYQISVVGEKTFDISLLFDEESGSLVVHSEDGVLTCTLDRPADIDCEEE